MVAATLTLVLGSGPHKGLQLAWLQQQSPCLPGSWALIVSLKHTPCCSALAALCPPPPPFLQELQAVVSKNLEALLPRDTTWAGSYPPRFDELLSPAGPDDQGGRFLEPDPEFDFDAFDYVPDFDFDPEFDPEFEEDMLDFDIEP